MRDRPTNVYYEEAPYNEGESSDDAQEPYEESEKEDLSLSLRHGRPHACSRACERTSRLWPYIEGERKGAFILSPSLLVPMGSNVTSERASIKKAFERSNSFSRKLGLVCTGGGKKNFCSNGIHRLSLHTLGECDVIMTSKFNKRPLFNEDGLQFAVGCLLNACMSPHFKRFREPGTSSTIWFEKRPLAFPLSLSPRQKKTQEEEDLIGEAGWLRESQRLLWHRRK